ncbi:hypothetical protein D3C80_1928370 [compost metagenome]
MELSKRGIHAGNSMDEKATNPVLRFYPPLTIEPEQISEVLQAVEQSLLAIARRPALSIKAFSFLVRNMYQIPNSLLRSKRGAARA